MARAIQISVSANKIWGKSFEPLYIEAKILNLCRIANAAGSLG